MRIVFEDSWIREECHALFPQLETHAWLDWEEHLEAEGFAPEPGFTEALQQFEQSVRQAPAETGDWWATLLQLRGAPLNTVDDAEFCFSFLPDTPKNAFLKKLMLLYLESGLAAGDRTARTQAAIEQSKGDPARDCVFIRGTTPSPLFAELARAHSHADARETWQWNPTEDSHPAFAAPVFEGTQVALLDRIADEVRKAQGRGKIPRVHFAGSDAARAYLRYRLAHLGLDAVTVLPFHPLPHSPGNVSLFFFQAEEKETSVLALDALERYRLRTAGFALPEAEPRKQRFETYFSALAERAVGQRRVFLTTNPHIPGLRVRALSRRRPPLPSRLPVFEKTLSPLPVLPATALEVFQSCPAKFYFTQLLRLRPKEDPSERFALTFGNLVHETLEKAFRLGPWREITAAVLQREFDTLLARDREQWKEFPWFEVALRKRFAPLTEAIPRLEGEMRAALGEMSPIRYEDSFEIQTSGLRLRGRLDRVDRVGESVIVLDYKTGSVDFSPEQVKKGTSFQALVYALAARERFGSVAGVLFYDLKKAEVRRGMVRAETLPPTAAKALTRGHTLSAENWDALLAAGEAHLAALGTQIASGEYPAHSSDAECAYCEFGDLCRQHYGWSGGAL